MSIYIIGVVIVWIVLTAGDMQRGVASPIGSFIVALCWPLFVATLAIMLALLVPTLLIAFIFFVIPAWWRYFKTVRENRK